MYTIEQIIQALEALNSTDVTNTTESYISNLASSGSEYASQFTKGGSPLHIYVPAATALACLIAIVIYFCTSNNNNDANEKARKILERKQTGFFRPKRTESSVDRKPTRKPTKVESLKITEVLADAPDEVTVATADKASEDQDDDKELPDDVAETVLKEHFGRDEGVDFSSSSSSDSSVDEAARSIKSGGEETFDNESTPTVSSTSYRSANAKAGEAEETETPEEPEHPFVTGSEEDQPEESDDEQNLADEVVMSDDEGYTRPVGLGLGPGSSSSSASNPTTDKSTRPRRSSWHGEDDDASSQSLDRAKFEEELKAKRRPTLDFPEEEKQQEAIPLPPTRRTTNKKTDRPPIKKVSSIVPTFGAGGIVPSRRTNTNKSEVSATAADPESSKPPGFTHGMMEAMAQYAAQNQEEGQTSPEVRYRRPQRAYRPYRSRRRI